MYAISNNKKFGNQIFFMYLAYECSTTNFVESDFCDKHLEAIVPNWFQNILPENNHWFSNWLVVCPEGEDSVWPDKASAERRIKASSRNCVSHYKSSGGPQGTWEGNQKDTILYDAFPFKINCLKFFKVRF